MAAELKHFYDAARVRQVADMVRGAWPAFPHRAFVREACAGLEGLELTARGRHVAAALRRALPGDVGEALGVLEASLGPPLPEADVLGQGMGPFLYLPHSAFVAAHGLPRFEEALRFQHALTRRFTAEFSLRPFLEAHPERTLAVLRGWARDGSVHVRRAVSEATRPRLPWAPRLRGALADVRHGLGLLELLKDDGERYVQRSVANHLNDVGKADPGLLLEVCGRWLAEGGPRPEGPAWVVRHALRSLVRAGHAGALGLLGHAGGEGVRVRGRVTPARVAPGGEVEVRLTVENGEGRALSVVVDLAVHAPGARGGTRTRVLKGRALLLAPGERAEVRKTLSLREMRTRTHHPGEHRVEARVNGRAVPVGRFHLG
jgi:3-methyladenine DNA glycosylase AlkC